MAANFFVVVFVFQQEAEVVSVEQPASGRKANPNVMHRRFQGKAQHQSPRAGGSGQKE